MKVQDSGPAGDVRFSISESSIDSETGSQPHDQPRIWDYSPYTFDPSVVIPSSEDGTATASSLAAQSSLCHAASDVGLDRDATLSTSPPCSSEGSCRMSNPSEDQWSQYRELITKLYWEDNLPMPAVREHMGTKYGFFATPRAYKFRFKKWGLRKNIKEHEARELVSGSKNPQDFWAGTKGLNFERRIARHMEKTKEGRCSRPGSRPRSPHEFDLAIQSSTQQPQRRLSDLRPCEALSAARHYWELWLTSGSSSFGGIWLHGEAGRERSVADESISNFFPLFERGLHALSYGQETQQAFADVDKSFTHLHGLIALRHPFVYMRIFSLASGYRQFPRVEVCYRVCCLLLDYCLGLVRTIYGEHGPLCRLWFAITDLIQAQDEPQYYDSFMESTRGTCAAVWNQTRGYMELGSVRLEAYVASPRRYQDEATLRHHMASAPTSSSQDETMLLPELQESRLALAELLINQRRILEALPVLAEAQHYQSLDFINPEGKGFWLAELAWRAGNPHRSVRVLECVLGVLEARPQTGPAPRDPPSVSAVQVLALLQHRHSMLLSVSQAKHCQRRIAASLATTAQSAAAQHMSPSPTLLHLAAGDYEVPVGPQSGVHVDWRPSP